MPEEVATGGEEGTPSKTTRSGSVVYPEEADQGKPKVFARQSFIVSGEDEEMAEAILLARQKAMERRRSTVDGIDTTALAASMKTSGSGSGAVDHTAVAAAVAEGEEGQEDEAPAAPTEAELANKERRRSSVLQRIPDNLKALIQQADKDGVQQKTEAPAGYQPPAAAVTPPPPAGGSDSDDEKPLRPSVEKRMGWCSGFLSCLKSASDADETMSRDTDDNPPEGGHIDRLLGPQRAKHSGRKLLVLDLDETLVHSSFKPVPRSDYTLDIQVDSSHYKVFVLKRPGAEEFLRRMSKIYEVIIFTASLPQYANPLLDMLDPMGYITDRLFREHCVFHEGYFVKDLTMLRGNRNLDDTIIVDNSPMAYMFQPENAIDCMSWIDEMDDTELEVIGDFLEATKDVKDVRDHVEFWRMGAAALGSGVPN